MQKITRIYVGNYGIDMAWYDGIVFDMTESETREPTDTIINLENGGGKTTLLSFIFSCFETSQERFLKHIQNRNHRFSQYFARDGLPGVVLIEWKMPPRTAGGSDYRLVIGQVVAVKTNVERDEVDRFFFSFEVRDGLCFESVPAPKLTLAPTHNMAEFVRWMQEVQKSSPENFFYTRIQQDWQKHLREERLVDVEMLQIQVNFSAQEGGIDTGFLTFHSEPEFLRKFFDLTLDSERAASVRMAVVNTCDKLRRKPFFQKRLNELLKLQNSLTQFDGFAQVYKDAQASQQETVTKGSGLILSLEARHRQKAATATHEHANAATDDNIALENDAAAKAHAEEAIVLTSLQHRRRQKAAQILKQEADNRLVEARKKLNHIRAAKLRNEIVAAEAKKKDLEALAASATEELQPWRENVEKHGAILRRALYTEEQKLRDEAASAEKNEHAAKEKRKSLISDFEKLAQREKLFVKEQAEFHAEEKAFESAKRQLIQDQKLDVGEGTAAAIQRWSDMAADQRAQEKIHRETAEKLRAQAEEWRATSRAAGEDAAKLETAIEQRQTFIVEGDAERESLSQLPILRQAAEADIADPDSPALFAALDRLAQSSEREVSQCDVRLAELRASKSSIEETGIAGSSRDVNEVVARLRDVGVRSAQPFNTYLAKAIPDAARARTLVASNPARFLGVCVASAEFEDARKIEGKITNLNAPVMVSVAALDPEPLDDDRIVLSASEDAAFNFDAAALLLGKLEEHLKTEEERRKAHANQQREAVSARQRLEAYCQRFGSGAIERASAEVARLTFEAAAAKERASHAEDEATRCQNGARERQADAEKSHWAADEAKRNIEALERFAKNHEEGRTAGLERLQAVDAELADISERRKEIGLQQEELDKAGQDAFKTRIEAESQAKQLGMERASLKYYNKDFPAKEHLAANPQALEVLRELYSNAAQTFEIEEKDKLGLLHQQLESARSELLDKTNTFSKNFPGVQLSDMTPYLRENFDALISSTQKEIKDADIASRKTGENLAVADTESKAFHRQNKTSYPPTPEMEMLSDDELATRIDRAASLKHAAEQAAQAAKITAARARELGRQAELEAKDALDKASLLRSVLSLPELLIAEPIVLSEDIAAQAKATVEEFNSRKKSVESAQKKAYDAFDGLRRSVSSGSLPEVEPEIAVQLQRNDFDAACADSQRLLEGIADRIGTTQSSLDGMQADFDACVGEVLNLANSAIALLNSATSNKKVPMGAPYVGGKAVLKIRARFQEIHQEARRQALQNYLDSLIDTHVIPAKGPELIADALLRIHGKPLGLQMLKMVPDESLQYVPVDKIQNSGGEGVVMAMFLYLIINQLRAETQAKLKKMGGGPLILDNPFAKATTPTLWKAQRLLAQAMDVQLIFATALPDYNTISEFNRFIRLRKAGKNTKTGRWHLEAVDFKLREQEAFTV